MSLQLAAKHLAAHGRGKDTELIHMDKGEIASLQQIAKANGGSLTINPHTGLPEAGFLSAMLPMIAGAGLMMIPGMQAGAAGLIVGGLKTAQSGSLSKGIMAGLGAYGGAGLAGSAGAAGASATNATNAAANTIPQAGPSFTDAQSFDPSVLNAPPPVVSSAAPIPDYGVRSPFTEGSSVLPTSPGGMNVTAPTPPNGGIPQAGPSYTDGQSMGYPAGTQPPTIPKSFEGMNAADRAASIKSGASFSNAGDFIADNKYTAAGALASVASGMKKDPVMTQPDKDMGQRYSYSADKANPIPAPDVPTYEDMLTKQGNYGRQQKYFSPSYTPISATAAKDLYHYAGGGPVEMMSDKAAVGANTMYPMANIGTSAFATPYQDPRSTNMMAGMNQYSGGTVDAMSGEPNMQGTRLAEGGEADEGFLASVARAFGKGPKKEDPGPKYTYSPEQQQYQQQATGGLSDAHYNLGGYSDGGISGSGNLNLNVPLDFGGANGGGGFGGAGANGYSAVGSGGGSQTGFTGQNNTAIGAKGGAGLSPLFNTGQTPFDNTFEGDTFQPQGTRAFGGNPQQMIGLLSSLMQGQQSGNASAQQPMQMAEGGLSDAHYNLGGYSDGGRLLRGPGDGVSDSIPAVIGKKQPARLADGEFVVPARIVSELGNGSTEAGARKLYAMMDRIQAARKKTVGKDKVAHNSRSSKYLPA